MKILWFKKVGEIASNTPWNPEANFAVYQKDEGWTELMASKHYKLSKCQGEFRATSSNQGFIAYMQFKQDNSSELSNDLITMLQAK